MIIRTRNLEKVNIIRRVTEVFNSFLLFGKKPLSLRFVFLICVLQKKIVEVTTTNISIKKKIRVSILDTEFSNLVTARISPKKLSVGGRDILSIIIKKKTIEKNLFDFL